MVTSWVPSADDRRGASTVTICCVGEGGGAGGAATGAEGDDAGAVGVATSAVPATDPVGADAAPDSAVMA
jgi:hypothetical protein